MLTCTETVNPKLRTLQTALACWIER